MRYTILSKIREQKHLNNTNNLSSKPIKENGSIKPTLYQCIIYNFLDSSLAYGINKSINPLPNKTILYPVQTLTPILLSLISCVRGSMYALTTSRKSYFLGQFNMHCQDKV